MRQNRSSPVTSLVSGSSIGQISETNSTPVTPAGYDFSIWGLICLASLAFAVSQVLPNQGGSQRAPQDRLVAGPRLRAEQVLLRLPISLCLGWAPVAASAGFGTTFRTFGMPARAWWVVATSVPLVLLATAASMLIVYRGSRTARSRHEAVALLG